MVTNLRVRLLQRQQCPCQAKHPGGAVLPTDHYAIYDFIVKGSCLCNGHADHCVPAGGQQKANNMVSHFLSWILGAYGSQLHNTPLGKKALALVL